MPTKDARLPSAKSKLISDSLFCQASRARMAKYGPNEIPKAITTILFATMYAHTRRSNDARIFGGCALIERDGSTIPKTRAVVVKNKTAPYRLSRNGTL